MCRSETTEERDRVSRRTNALRHRELSQSDVNTKGISNQHINHAKQVMIVS
jgi:hypothetical protein